VQFRVAFGPVAFPLGKGIRVVCFSPDGAFIAAGFGEPKVRGRVVVWDAKTHKPALDA